MTDSRKLRSRVQEGLLAPVDVHFAGQIASLDGALNPAVLLGAALVSRATGAGHVCLDLAAASEQTGWPAAELPTPAAWIRQLRRSRAVGAPGDYTPLVLDDRGRLYLFRYWQYEQRLIAGIRKRLTPTFLPQIDWKRLQGGLARLFPSPPAAADVDWQKLAALVAVTKPFCVISGGPGTGKTTTVAKILVLLLEQNPGLPLRIRLAAPTGKAAARLGESLQAAGETLACTPDVKSALPTSAATLHRLLQPISGTPEFRYDADNPLPADIVIVDEASMVDLALMSKLVQSLADNARLILVGDRDQLASVEAGAALGDICGRGRRQGYSEAFLAAARPVVGESLQRFGPAGEIGPPIQDSIVHLIHSYRFSGAGRIEALSRAVNQGDAEAMLTILRDETDASVRWRPASTPQRLQKQLRALIVEGYGNVTAADRPEKGLKRLNRFRLLCALKQGPQGAAAINRVAEQILRAERIIAPADSPWYPGRPVLITENDYSLGLFNGDIGLTAVDPDFPKGPLQVWFPGFEGPARRIPAYRIGAHETVFAMTVHKSQGSEFDHVYLVLPDADAPVLSRELLYTAVTRARRSVTLWGSERTLRATVGRKIERNSGLRDALWGAAALPDAENTQPVNRPR